MNINKIVETESILKDPTVDKMKDFTKGLEKLADAVQNTIRDIKDIYDKPNNIWVAWCATNLTEDEKLYINTLFSDLKKLDLR